jgi:putative GTP pyrophosphokinase
MTGPSNPLPSKGAVDRAGRALAQAYLGPVPEAGADVIEFAAESFADRRAFFDAAALVRAWRSAHAYPLQKASANLRHDVRDSPGARVTQRLKKFGTIVDKLGRFDRMKLSRMEDIGGCRVVVSDVAEARELARRLKKNWIVSRDRDYVLEPKVDGYRARHLVTVKDSRFVEVQIRTRLQDLWANTVERDGRRSGIGLKFGDGEPGLREQYRRVSELMAAEERGESLPPEALADLARTFSTGGGRG